MTALQQQVENLVEHKIEDPTAARTTHAELQQADFCLKDFSAHLDGVSQGKLGAGAGGSGGQEGLPSGVRLEKPRPFLVNSKDPEMLKAFLYRYELCFSWAGKTKP